MKKIIIMTILVASAIEIHAQQSQNQTNVNTGSGTAIQLSLTPDIALFPRTTTVNGLSLNIWGENPQHGVTVGLVNGSTGESAGFSWELLITMIPTKVSNGELSMSAGKISPAGSVDLSIFPREHSLVFKTVF